MFVYSFIRFVCFVFCVCTCCCCRSMRCQVPAENNANATITCSPLLKDPNLYWDYPTFNPCVSDYKIINYIWLLSIIIIIIILLPLSGILGCVRSSKLEMPEMPNHYPQPFLYIYVNKKHLLIV